MAGTVMARVYGAGGEGGRAVGRSDGRQVVQGDLRGAARRPGAPRVARWLSSRGARSATKRSPELRSEGGGLLWPGSGPAMTVRGWGSPMLTGPASRRRVTRHGHAPCRQRATRPRLDDHTTRFHVLPLDGAHATQGGAPADDRQDGLKAAGCEHPVLLPLPVMAVAPTPQC